MRSSAALACVQKEKIVTGRAEGAERGMIDDFTQEQPSPFTENIDCDGENIQAEMGNKRIKGEY